MIYLEVVRRTVSHDTLFGTLTLEGLPVAEGTMVYKTKPIDKAVLYTTQYYAMLYCAIQCCITLNYAILHQVKLCYARLYETMLRYAVQ